MRHSHFQKILAPLIVAALFAAPVFAQETQRLYLSGHDKDDAVPWKFFCTGGALSGFWTNLPVPSHWDMHGFGSLNYHKDGTNPESGLYEHDFTVTKSWRDKRVFLVFEGAMTDTSAKLNGESTGPMHQGSFYRFKYEVTKLVKPGAKNKLEVTVAKHSANESVNRAERLADYWVFGGIFRPVYLEAVPQQFIERVAIDAKADGAFAMDVFLNGVTNADTLEAQVITLDGKKVGAAFVEKIAGEKATLKAQIPSPRQWTAETPNLYKVQVRLKRNGKVIHQIEQRFGFRTMEVREGDGLYVNGHRVVLKGADRHSFWPDSGRCLSEAVHRLDIETMKDMNMNAVRMSHYPPDAQFLDLCDELGLYVLDELAGWHNRYDNEVGTKLVKEMVVRDVNHPCILFWDNGNEGGFNTNLDHLFGEFDPQQRHVLHPWAIFGGVNTGHYNLYDQVKMLCSSNTIYMPTEFQHGLFDGGAAAGLEDYWKVMGHSKICAGGFIWVLEDDAVKRPDTGAMDTAGNQAPDGIVGPYRQREGSFYAIKEIWSPIQVTREADGTFTVENHYGFTDASQCRFTWQLRKFPKRSDTRAGFIVVRKGEVDAPSILPGDRGALKINLPDVQADALALRVDDPNGRELWTYVWSLADENFLKRNVGLASQFDSFENGIEQTMKFGDVTVFLDGALLKGVERAGQKFSLSGGPRPVSPNSKLTKIAWTFREDGWLQCDYAYTAKGTNDSIGVVFDYPESLVTGKRWLGDGPYRVWKNRLRGETLNVWENKYNNTITGWRDWIYPEFKGCFANVYWMQLETSEGLITAIPSSRDIFVQVLTPEFPPASTVGKTLVNLPPAGLAFLDAIPAVGSKFKDATTTGPQGQPNVAHGEYSGSVSFYFGKLP